MRILMINDYARQVAGAETFIYTLKKILELKGHKVEIFGSEGIEDFKSFFSRWYSFKWYNKTINKIKEFRPDIVHVNGCARIISPSVLIAAKKMKIPTIMTIHDFHFVCPKTWGIKYNGEPCEKWIGARCIIGMCKSAKPGIKHYPIFLAKLLRVNFHRKLILGKNLTLIAPSKILANSMTRSLGKKVFVINNGINIPEKKTKYSKNILFVGRLTEDKGVQCVAGALDKVKGYNVSIVGDGDYLAELISKYKNINFLGFQKNPRIFYEKASIVFIPSIWMENFSYVVLEAMSYGICVIASKRGGIPEQIIDGESGVLFEAGNEKDFSEKLNKLLKNPEEIKRIGENARKRVVKNWDWKIIVKQYENLYKKII